MESQTPTNQQDGQQPPVAQAGYQLRYFDRKTYDQIFQTHVEVFQLFLHNLSSKGIRVDPNELAHILNSYWAQYMRFGTESDSTIPKDAKCVHMFKKGDRNGQICNKDAFFRGLEGKPKCSTHRNSKPNSSDPTVVSSAQSDASFSYKNHKNSGSVVGQNLSSLQNSIMEQSIPCEIQLQQNEHGIVFDKNTNLVFVQKEDGAYYAVGVLGGDGKTVDKLSASDTYLCFANKWKWDKDRVNNDTGLSEHPMGTHTNEIPVPVMSAEDGQRYTTNNPDLIRAKLNAFNNNNNVK